VENSSHSVARQLGARLVQLAHQMAQAVIFLAGEVGVEGVGFDEIDAGFQILAADILDDLRLGQSQKIIVALQLGRMIAEALAPEIILAQLEALDHHAPGTVQQKQALLGLFLHPGNAGFSRVKLMADPVYRLEGRMPRMRQAAYVRFAWLSV
jgi:hypothetical protein